MTQTETQSQTQSQTESQTQSKTQVKNKPFIDSADYHKCVKKLREFFEGKKKFMEVATQSRLSILAACEDPGTIATINYAGQVWPLPQTGQMHLEFELMLNPTRAPGYFCLTTSYRHEPNPVQGRHDIIFPLFEFEFAGDMDELLQLERELLSFLGFKEESFKQGKYEEVAKKFGVETLEHEHEHKLAAEESPVFFLTHFPLHTSPFWNMKLQNDKYIAKKVDVILEGMETIGSAERSCNKEEMKKLFDTISEGGYAKILYEKFGRERVEAEMQEFLNLPFITRCGGGIGVTRLIRAMKLQNLL